MGLSPASTRLVSFVELEEIYVDGLVHITALQNDYYHYDPVGHRLTGERTGRVLRLGDPLTIVVAKVNLDDRKIDFVPADGGGQTTGKKRKSRRSESGPGSSKASKAKASGKEKRSGKKKQRRKRSKSTSKKH